MLFRSGSVLSEEHRESGDTVLEVRLQNRDWLQLLSRADMREQDLRLDTGTE